MARELGCINDPGGPDRRKNGSGIPLARRMGISTYALPALIFCLYPIGWLLISAMWTGQWILPQTIPFLAYSAGCVGGALVALRACKRENDAIKHFDPQQQIFNERFFLVSLRLEFNRSRRHDFPMAVMVFSYDLEGPGIKAQAKTNGIGKAIDKTILKSIRTSDIFSRLREDSFALLLPNSGTDGAQVVANRIASHLNQEVRKHKLGARVVPAFGICGLGCNGVDAPEDIMAGALRAYDEARQSHRNRINLCSPNCV
ncbi:GGDEF domain-containing protein [Salidesulfovibrio brasiliensis]|uniref:GGDEF domain-containing protein n=1 Tax=Salidesulfovibrio brasiliensis TaxID=221711 RepID=UPI0006D26018|nr:GGDEF domain-containing protein [Salidesulfovibrio brasiliensis]